MLIEQHFNNVSDSIYIANNANEITSLLNSDPEPAFKYGLVATTHRGYATSHRNTYKPWTALEPTKPFTSRCMDYVRNHTVEVLRSSLDQARASRRQLFPSLRQIYRWFLLLLLLLVDEKEDREASTSAPVVVRRIGYSDSHVQSTQMEKDFSDKKLDHAQFTPRTDPKQEPKDGPEAPGYSNGVDASRTVNSPGADTLIIQMKSGEILDTMEEISNTSDAMANTKTYLLKHERYHKNTRSLPQISRFPAITPKKQPDNSDNPIEQHHVQSRSPRVVDLWRQKSDGRNMPMASSHRNRTNRLLHSSSSPDLRKQRSASQTSREQDLPILLRHDSDLSCSSSSSTSSRRTSAIRGNGVQLIGGKTIGEIIHANPLLRRDEYVEGATPWRI
ncbi:hypothetical protein INT43_008005 [Umbelopsis isabellina]|uniref:Uncharacterized protein n=1 Tax=Mortierella isabellina TaxID=91625 RepID=A0A8H7PNQ2_MORIS|nr:hypothetical protein INT43_008005 [Umbelopsis isabellina]